MWTSAPASHLAFDALRPFDAAFINSAVDLAESSAEKGNHPFGAILVKAGRLVLAAENTVVTSQDCTAHAEMNLVRRASGLLSREERQQSVIYSSTEPCAMCAGAIYWSGIRGVVYGCPAQVLARFTSASFVVSCREVFARGAEATFIEGPCFADRAIALHSRFWTMDS